MKVQQLINASLVLLVTCEAKQMLLRRQGRELLESMPGWNSSTSSLSNGTSTFEWRSDDLTDDSVDSNKTGADEIDIKIDSSDISSKSFVFVHKKEVSMEIKDDDNNASLFTPPAEVEPHFWKEAIAGMFLAAALILCGLTAYKTCCKPKGYQQIPSTTLIV